MIRTRILCRFALYRIDGEIANSKHLLTPLHTHLISIDFYLKAKMKNNIALQLYKYNHKKNMN